VRPLVEIRAAACALPCGAHTFEAALAKPGLSFICELKKASPSKGLISPRFPYLDILSAYEQAGADALSCLTEPQWFLGSDEIFAEVRTNTALPMIRKDFTVDAYQLYEAKLMGADAVLLIVSLLSPQQLEEYLAIAEELGLDALVETHDAEEIKVAASVGARLIGVNNRNLKTFTVDFANAERLRNLIPANTLYVAESGVKTPADVAHVAAMGADAVLMGEALMRASNPSAFLQECRQAAGESTAAPEAVFVKDETTESRATMAAGSAAATALTVATETTAASEAVGK
jgi:indole-3-glycerol phosphate synthase